MNEQQKYEIIKELADHPHPNKHNAALRIGCSLRHVNRMLSGYKNEGKKFFVHGNRGRSPVNKISDELKSVIYDSYKNEYAGANFEHFTEKLLEDKGICISTTSVTSILEDRFVVSPKATRAKRKQIKERIKQLQNPSVSKKEVMELQTHIVDPELAHPRHPRASYYGELIQMDASPYEWIPHNIWHLHVAIDDATGEIVGAYFDTQETLNGYYHVLYQIILNHGIPYKLLTDRRTVFTYTKKANASIGEDSYTQFAYACKNLGVQLESTSVPQAKGRVERLNQTLQSRLPIELKSAGVKTIDVANEFLNSYIKKLNVKFGLQRNNITSVFQEQTDFEKINLTLAVLCERTVDCGHCLRHNHKYYKTVDARGKQVFLQPKTKAIFIQAFDGNMYCSIDDKYVYALEEIPEHEAKSPNFDMDYEPPKPKPRYIPPMNHPWRRLTFSKFVRRQAHHQNDDYSA